MVIKCCKSWLGSFSMGLDALDYKTYAEAKERFRYSARWTVFDADRERLNIANECIDRHPKEEEAVRIQFAGGHRQVYTFGEMSRLTSQFAHLLSRKGVNAGDRVAVILNPSQEFYVTLFGTLKRGAVIVPCFPAFGPDAIEYRLNQSAARMVVTSEENASSISGVPASHIVMGHELRELLQGQPEEYKTETSSDSLAVIQFSSGTTGAPKMVPYRHAAATLAAVNVKISAGLRQDDRYFCPSSPAWGHGIWFGTIAPLVFGRAVGAYSGKFRAEMLLEALEEFEITNLSAAPLVYRMVKECGKIGEYRLRLRDMSFTGAAMDADTALYFQQHLGITPRSMYGSTEIGAVLVDYPYHDWPVKAGSMGRAMLGVEAAVIDEEGKALPPGQVGQIAANREGRWLRTGDAAFVDEEGYFWHKGRLDDIIISAGYTIGPLEIEEALEKHPAVLRAAVVGSPDQERGEVVKAFVITDQEPGPELEREIQEFVRTRLSKHEYPREIQFVAGLPETPDGKIKRKELRDLERARKGATAG